MLTHVGAEPPAASETAFDLNHPATRAAGVPGGGGIIRAADLALFYQALLHNPGSLWKPECSPTRRATCAATSANRS